MTDQVETPAAQQATTPVEVGPFEQIIDKMLNGALKSASENPERVEELKKIMLDKYGAKKEFISAEHGIDVEALAKTLNVQQKWEVMYALFFSKFSSVFDGVTKSVNLGQAEDLFAKYEDQGVTEGILRDANNLVVTPGSGLFEFQKKIDQYHNLSEASSLVAQGVTYVLPASGDSWSAQNLAANAFRHSLEEKGIQVNLLSPYELVGTGDLPADGSVNLVIVPNSSDPELESTLGDLYAHGKNFWLDAGLAKRAKTAAESVA